MRPPLDEDLSAGGRSRRLSLCLKAVETHLKVGVGLPVVGFCRRLGADIVSRGRLPHLGNQSRRSFETQQQSNARQTVDILTRAGEYTTDGAFEYLHIYI